MSQFRNSLMVSSYLASNKIVYDLSSNLIELGSDFMVYDHFLEKFGVLKSNTLDFGTFDFNRFETNFDIPFARFSTSQGNYLHAVAIDEAIDPDRYSGIQLYNYIDSNYCAAEYSYYRIEVDNSKAGGFHFTVTTSNGTSEGDVSWNANDSVASIREQMGTPALGAVFIKYDVTTNNPIIPGNTIRSISGEAIGVAAGGYGNNYCVLSSIIDNSAQLIDMSKYAVISDTLTVNDPYDDTLTVLNGNYKNWRGVSCQTILGSDLIPIGTNATAICNSGYNYSYRSGVNFTGFKSWATGSGNVSYTTDGVNGTVNNSVGVIMQKTYFDEMMNSSNTNYNAQMSEYYNNLLTSNDEPYKTLRDTYSRWYDYEPQTLYDGYLMTHMLKLNPGSGIVFSTMNRGRELTNVKGKVFTVTYNYTYVPAYPPEYNALHYGKPYDPNENTVFTQGFYYHPETGDVGTFVRDDMIKSCNTSWATVPTNIHSYRTNLSNSTYLGTVGEYNSYTTWNFNGNGRVLNYYYRAYSVFRSRPCSAYLIS